MKTSILGIVLSIGFSTFAFAGGPITMDRDHDRDRDHGRDRDHDLHEFVCKASRNHRGPIFEGMGYNIEKAKQEALEKCMKSIRFHERETCQIIDCNSRR